MLLAGASFAEPRGTRSFPTDLQENIVISSVAPRNC
jgi:hypothetical protein